MRNPVYLLPNELAALVEALTRDSRNERIRALRHPDARDYHLQNVRMNTRILETFGHVASQDPAVPNDTVPGE